MTTIAFDGNVLASDARWCDDEVQVVSRTKISRLPSGALYGGAGSSDDRELLALLSKIKSPRYLPSLAALGVIRQDLRAILVFPTRRAFVIDTHHVSPGEPEAKECGVYEIDNPCAIGSGGKLALAAMLAGASAFEAVKIACRLDPQSAGPVYRLTLNPKNK